MIFQRFQDDGLAQFSYAVGSERAEEVVIVDPRRDVDVYLRFAREAGVRIAHVVETHIHADYASGAADLAARAGAELHLSAYDDGERYEVSFPHRQLREGDALRLGEVRLQALHTPGHTPEHLSFLVYDDDASTSRPVRFLTGDFLFIGSLGRPDLLGEEEKRALADALYDSVRRVVPGLPDDLWIHPGHGSGSMCGGGMSRLPERRLGQEREENPFLDPELDRDSFVDRLLSTLPPYPAYYSRMKDRNAGGEDFGRPWPEPAARNVERVREAVADGAVVVDTRHQLAVGGGHVPGALGIGLGTDLSTWAGWVVPYDRPIILVTDTREAVADAVTRLARVGLDRIDGYLHRGMNAWVTAAGPLARIAQWTPHILHDRLDDGVVVLDVRSDEEWDSGHIDGALHIMGGHLQDEIERLPATDAEVAVICGTGYRSTVAATVLRRNGYVRVRNVAGGMTAWEAAGLPIA